MSCRQSASGCELMVDLCTDCTRSGWPWVVLSKDGGVVEERGA